MDNLCAGIRASSDQHKKGAGYRGLSASIAPDFHPHQGVAGFTGIGGSFRMEWVAALPWNQWQAWSGIRMPTPKRFEIAGSPAFSSAHQNHAGFR
jgi:hypothetical protein